MSANHTATPWKYHLGRGANPRFHIQTTGGYQIAETTQLDPHSQASVENEEREANAAFIVRACNCHEELVEAAERVLSSSWDIADPDCPARMELEAALAKAKAKGQP